MHASPGSRKKSAHLERWVSAGLLTATQAEAIAHFEAQRDAEAAVGRPARAIALLGALTLVSGLGSIVAYNWDGIGAALKLTGMGVLLAAAGAYALRARALHRTSFEVAALVTSGLSLGSLGLVSQIYAQDGELWQLLSVWYALTLPLLLLTQSRFLSLYLFVAGVVTLTSAAGSIDEFLRGFFSQDSELATALLLYFGTAVGALGFHKSAHPERRSVGVSLFQLHLVGLGAIGGLCFLEDGSAEPLFVVLGVLGAIAVSALLYGKEGQDFELGPWPVVAGLFALGVLQVILPLGIVRTESSFLGFAAFILFFGAYFWAAERANNESGVRLAVGLIGLRVVIASFELFENLLVTGAVLASLGTFALILTRRRLGTTRTS